MILINALAVGAHHKRGHQNNSMFNTKTIDCGKTYDRIKDLEIAVRIPPGIGSYNYNINHRYELRLLKEDFLRYCAET